LKEGHKHSHQRGQD